MFVKCYLSVYNYLAQSLLTWNIIHFGICVSETIPNSPDDTPVCYLPIFWTEILYKTVFKYTRASLIRTFETRGPPSTGQGFSNGN